MAPTRLLPLRLPSFPPREDDRKQVDEALDERCFWAPTASIQHLLGDGKVLLELWASTPYAMNGGTNTGVSVRLESDFRARPISWTEHRTDNPVSTPIYHEIERAD